MEDTSLPLLPLSCARDSRLVTYRVNMCPLVLRSVARVAEGLVTLAIRADVGSLACVRAQVDLQVFQSRESLVASVELLEREREKER